MPRQSKATAPLADLRRAVADYVSSEGCSCCRGSDHDKHLAAIAKLLRVPKYGDGSGYAFTRYTTKKTTGRVPLR